MEYSIEAKGIKKEYTGFVLDIPQFKMETGKTVGLIGKNGAGKTTFLDILLDRRTADSGKISFLGQVAINKSCKEEIGFVVDGGFLDGNLSAYQVDKIMKYIYKNWDEKYFYELLKELGVDTKKQIKTFSRGMKIKLEAAVCLAHKPKILILDEVTSGLDPAMRMGMIKLLKTYVEEREATLLFSTHIIADIEEIGDEVCLIENGKMIFKKELDSLLDSYILIKNDFCLKKDEKQFIEKELYNMGQWYYLVRKRNQKRFLQYEQEKISLGKLIMFYF